jgi:hypothetical protein
MKNPPIYQTSSQCQTPSISFFCHIDTKIPIWYLAFSVLRFIFGGDQEKSNSNSGFIDFLFFIFVGSPRLKFHHLLFFRVFGFFSTWVGRTGF